MAHPRALASWSAPVLWRITSHYATRFFCLLLFAASLNVRVLAQSPLIHRLSPLGIPAGRTTELKIVGERVSGITDGWLGLPGTEIVKTNESSLLISTAPDAAGVCALRIATTNGASELSMIFIDDLPTTAASGTNNSPQTAQSIRPPVAIDGVSRELGFDYYSFDAKRGEVISFEVVASRLGSRLDPVLRILDAKGREVAFNEDAPGAGRDCRLQFRPPATGQYLAEVRDITYGGGPQYYYRLRAGKFAFPTCTYPLAGEDDAELRVLSSAGDARKPLACRMRPAPYTAVNGDFVALHSLDQPQITELEPNNSAAQGTTISLPTVLNGRFEKADDRDWFQFDADKDERWIFRSRSRSLGSPCDVFFEIRDEAGKEVATAIVGGPQDASATNTLKAAGRYHLVAKELTHRGGPDLAYQIEIERFRPGFALFVDDDKIEAKNGTEVSLSVACLRYDFNDKIDLKVDGLPGAFSVEGARFDEKKTNTVLKIKVPASAHPGTLITFAVFGKSGVVEARASTIPALRRNFPLILYPPSELSGVIALGITAGTPAPEPKRRRG